MHEVILKVAVTPEHDCSYLPYEREQLLVIVDNSLKNAEDYERLLTVGFRRSGEDLYRPHCRSCNACQSIRIHCPAFMPSRSQRRVQKRNQDLHIRYNHHNRVEYYPIYQRYISQRHADGSMNPPSPEQYRAFVLCSWLEQVFIEFHACNRLIGVAVTDVLPNGLSAMYSFFEPSQMYRSLGKLAIMQQIALANQLGKQWLYLGYQVDDCQKMNYKTQFQPYERLQHTQWVRGSEAE